MANIVEDTKGKIRNLPIQQKLREVLNLAADTAGIDTVRVTSGGQPPAPDGPRVGSTRHDNGWAADLQLVRKGKTLSFTDELGGPVIEAFVTAAAAHGATGIGAGVDYMGAKTFHIGFGTSPQDTSKLVWGAGGRAAAAPTWLKAAAQKGWSSRSHAAVRVGATRGSGTHVVIARGGLRLRGGPGTEFGVTTTLGEGTRITVLGFDGPRGEWARVDLEDDGLVDGHVLAAFLAPIGGSEHEETLAEDVAEP